MNKNGINRFRRWDTSWNNTSGWAIWAITPIGPGLPPSLRTNSTAGAARFTPLNSEGPFNRGSVQYHEGPQDPEGDHCIKSIGAPKDQNRGEIEKKGAKNESDRLKLMAVFIRNSDPKSTFPIKFFWKIPQNRYIRNPSKYSIIL